MFNFQWLKLMIHIYSYIDLDRDISIYATINFQSANIESLCNMEDTWHKRVVEKDVKEYTKLMSELHRLEMEKIRRDHMQELARDSTPIPGGGMCIEINIDIHLTNIVI